MDKRPGTAECSGNLPDGPAFRAKTGQLSSIENNGLPTDRQTFRAPVSDSGLTSADYAPFKLRQGSNDGEHHFAGWCECVDGLAELAELDAQTPKGFKSLGAGEWCS